MWLRMESWSLAWSRGHLRESSCESTRKRKREKQRKLQLADVVLEKYHIRTKLSAAGNIEMR